MADYARLDHKFQQPLRRGITELLPSLSSHPKLLASNVASTDYARLRRPQREPAISNTSLELGLQSVLARSRPSPHESPEDHHHSPQRPAGGAGGGGALSPIDELFKSAAKRAFPSRFMKRKSTSPALSRSPNLDLPSVQYDASQERRYKPSATMSRESPRPTPRQKRPPLRPRGSRETHDRTPQQLEETSKSIAVKGSPAESKQLRGDFLDAEHFERKLTPVRLPVARPSARQDQSMQSEPHAPEQQQFFQARNVHSMSPEERRKLRKERRAQHSSLMSK